MNSLEKVFAGLARSRFRSKFRLAPAEQRYLCDKGLPAVIEHARTMIAQRLAPANLPNDGKQTPFRGHPVFVAQHATATCCRSCLAKWHGIAASHALTEEEQQHIIAALTRWLQQQGKPPDRPAVEPRQLRMF